MTYKHLPCCGLFVPHTTGTKSPMSLPRQLEHQWGIHGSLTDLSGSVAWYTNCTTYETGKRFRFCKENMGDYKIGYVEHPDIPLSHVMAASAGFPVLIGPYCLSTSGYKWSPSKYSSADYSAPDKIIHLWDGGVYEQFGVGVNIYAGKRRHFERRLRLHDCQQRLCVNWSLPTSGRLHLF